MTSVDGEEICTGWGTGHWTLVEESAAPVLLPAAGEGGGLKPGTEAPIFPDVPPNRALVLTRHKTWLFFRRCFVTRRKGHVLASNQKQTTETLV